MSNTIVLGSDEAMAAFMVGLTKLTRELGVCISGCGCCGSPSAEHLKPEQLVPEAGYGKGRQGEIYWISPSDSWGWENYGDTVLKIKGLI